MPYPNLPQDSQVPDGDDAEDDREENDGEMSSQDEGESELVSPRSAPSMPELTPAAVIPHPEPEPAETIIESSQEDQPKPAQSLVAPATEELPLEVAVLQSLPALSEEEIGEGMLALEKGYLERQEKILEEKPNQCEDKIDKTFIEKLDSTASAGSDGSTAVPALANPKAVDKQQIFGEQEDSRKLAELKKLLAKAKQDRTAKILTCTFKQRFMFLPTVFKTMLKKRKLN